MKFLEIISLATIGSERVVIGSLSKDNSNEQEMTKKQKVFVGKRTTLQAFLYISLPSLHDYDLIMPDFMFCVGREHRTRTFFFFS